MSSDNRRKKKKTKRRDNDPVRVYDDGLGFRLVPWASALEQQLGRQVSGVIRDGGGLDLMMGRKRGLGL